MVKIVIGHKSGKTKQVEVETKPLIGKKIKESFKGELINLPGYEFEITGGSDSSGFPMRRDVDSQNKKKVLIVKGVGLKKATREGDRRRRTVAGNTVSKETAQLNVKVTKEGKEPLFEAAAEEKVAE
jgi:small subunit ribosomal protein S6e